MMIQRVVWKIHENGEYEYKFRLNIRDVPWDIQPAVIEWVRQTVNDKNTYIMGNDTLIYMTAEETMLFRLAFQ